jgi:hypothetical protein
MLHSVVTHDDGMDRFRRMTKLCAFAMMVEFGTCKREMEMKTRTIWRKRADQINQVYNVPHWVQKTQYQG